MKREREDCPRAAETRRRREEEREHAILNERLFTQTPFTDYLVRQDVRTMAGLSRSTSKSMRASSSSILRSLVEAERAAWSEVFDAYSATRSITYMRCERNDIFTYSDPRYGIIVLPRETPLYSFLYEFCSNFVVPEAMVTCPWYMTIGESSIVLPSTVFRLNIMNSLDRSIFPITYFQHMERFYIDNETYILLTHSDDSLYISVRFDGSMCDTRDEFVYRGLMFMNIMNTIVLPRASAMLRMGKEEEEQEAEQQEQAVDI